MIPPNQGEHNLRIDGNISPAPSSCEWTPGTILLDDYRIERILGRGGMGEVVLVRSTSMQRYYAVKRILPKWLTKDSHRRMFLRELLTWSDLPDHPNLTAFRFFRTLDDELLIFTDYIGGGSLKQWIAGNRFTSLDIMLHIAIQTAWGLHVAHESGVLHQDVKPDNILMDTDGTPRITDFGLARVMTIRHPNSDETDESIDEDTASSSSSEAFASCSGGTPGFCSPEQFEKKPLTRGSDIWSWGLTVLAMFNYDTPWKLGPMAREILRSYLEKDHGDSPVPFMPAALAALLDRCFQYKLSDRYGSFEEIVNPLLTLYQETCGEPYDVPLAKFSRSDSLPVSEFTRSNQQGFMWRNPMAFVETGCSSTGYSSYLLTRIIPERLRTRKALAISDLILFDEAQRLLGKAPARVRDHPESGLVPLHLEKALVHRFLGDVSGALHLYDSAIELMERSETQMPDNLAYAIYREKGITLNAMQRFREADAYLCHVLWVENQRRDNVSESIRSEKIKLMDLRAKTLRELGDRESAFRLFDRAIREYGELIEGRRDHSVNQYLAGVLMNKANSFPKSGASTESIELYDQAIALLEHLDSLHSTQSLRADLALVYSNKAAALFTRGDYSTAAGYYRSAIAIREPLMNSAGYTEIASDLALNYSNLANALWGMGETETIQTLYDEAIRIREHLVLMEGRSEISVGLVSSCNNRAVLANLQKDFPTAERLTRLARRILFHLIDLEPREELDVMLARVTQTRAETLNLMADFDGAYSAICDVCRIWERLASGSASQDYSGFLGMSLATKARILFNMGKTREAFESIDISIELFEKNIGKSRWSQFIVDLFMARRHKVTFLEKTGRSPDAVEYIAGSFRMIERFKRNGDRPEYELELAMLKVKEFILLHPDHAGEIPGDVRQSADYLIAGGACFSYPEIGDMLTSLGYSF